MYSLVRSFGLSLSLALLLVAVAGVAGARASGGEIVFTSPAGEQTHYIVGQPFALSWQESVVSDSRELVQEEAPLDIDGGCLSVGWQAAASSAPAETTVALELAANRCYRWTVTLTTAETTYSATSGAVRTLKAWNGKLNLYRKGVFSTQHKWDWCVAAGTQIMFNIILGESDQSRAGQKRYYTHARANDLTPDSIPGADPRGWAAALNHFGGGGYSDVSKPTFRSSLRLAAKRMRLTGKPVGVLARAGDHAMVLNGFTATADPATDPAFEVKAVYIMGPLYPTNSSYDPPPNSRFSAGAFKRKYFQRYDDPFGSAKWSVWEGYFVTINP